MLTMNTGNLRGRAVALMLCLIAMFGEIAWTDGGEGEAVKVEAFETLKIKGDGFQDATVNSIRSWSFVSPGWLIAVVDSISSEEPDSFPVEQRQRTLGVLSVDPVTSKCRWLRFLDKATMVGAVIGTARDECGIVIRDHLRPQDGGYLLKWNLLTDNLVTSRAWPSDVNAIAAQIDLSEAAVEVARKDERGELVDSAKLCTKAHRTCSTIPLARREYVLPMSMNSRWEEKQDSKWYCRWDGVGLVFFHGRRPDGAKPGDAYAPESTITLFDPRVEGGVRWRRNLIELGIAPRDGLLPIATPWRWQREVLLESTDLSYHADQFTVSIYRISSDGSVVERKFIADGEYHVEMRWPRCTVDMERIVYLIGDMNPRLRVFNFEAGRAEADVGCPTRWARRLITILPNDEALVTDDRSLWGIDLSPGPRRKTRLITEVLGK